MKLLTDTCSAIKLLAFGNKIFQPNALVSGDIIIHSRVFREVRKWDSSKKEKYKQELALLHVVGNKDLKLSVSANDFQAHRIIVQATIDHYGFSVGAGDIEQLISAIHHDLKIVTDDRHFNKLAEALEVEKFDAEDIVLEARDLGVISQKEINAVKLIWLKNGEKSQGKI